MLHDFGIGEEDDDDKVTLGLVEAAPRISIHTLETPSACTHEVAVPPNCNFTGKKCDALVISFLLDRVKY